MICNFNKAKHEKYVQTISYQETLNVVCKKTIPEPKKLLN